MKRIIIDIIPHKSQRYDSVDDYEVGPDGTLLFRVSQTNEKYEFLVIMHALIEAFLAAFRGIDWKAIDEFDTAYTGTDEPGDQKDAPYQKEHRYASVIEALLCLELGLDWDEYCKVLNDLPY